MVWVLIPVLVGLSQPILWAMNDRVAKGSGQMEAAVLLHVVGALFGLALVFIGLKGAQGLAGVLQVPWWAWLAGVIGISGMAGMIRAIPEIGVASALAIVVAAQLLASVVFEHYGWMGLSKQPLTLWRLAGALMCAVGAWLVTR